MLEAIRSKRNSVLILAAFAAIIVVFIFWGVGPNTGGDNDMSVVATVDGQSITVKEYAGLYKRETEYYKNALKEQFTEEFARKMNLKQRALDILINRALALKEARSQGISVTQDEVRQAIGSIPAFGKNGAFDKEVYLQVLSSNRLTPSEFEKNVEDDLITTKIRDKIIKDISVTDEEIRAEYAKEARKIDLSYVAVDGSRFRGKISVDDSEAREYLKANSSVFMEPARVKAFYAYADYSDSQKKAKVTDAEIKEYYEKNIRDFELPESVKARHILVRPDPQAADPEKSKKDAKDRIESILNDLKAGKNFADLAKANSQDPGSAKSGGDLGWFQRGIMVKSFEDAAFSLGKGQMSGVIETEFGYHIIKVDDKKEAGLAPYNQAEPSIRRTLQMKKGEDGAREAMTALEGVFGSATSMSELKKAAAEKGVKVAETDFFAESDSNAELVRAEEARNVVFTLKQGESSRAIGTREGIYIIKVLDRVEAHVPDYEKIAPKVKARIMDEKAAAEAVKKAEEILNKVKAGEDISAIAKAEGLKVESSGYFSRVDGFMPKVGAFVADNDDIFNLTEAAPYYKEVLKHNNRNYILKLASSKEADEAGLERRREEIRGRLTGQKQEEVLGKWVKGLKEKADIKVYSERL